MDVNTNHHQSLNWQYRNVTVRACSRLVMTAPLITRTRKIVSLCHSKVAVMLPPLAAQTPSPLRLEGPECRPGFCIACWIPLPGMRSL